jgi:hypothetical protein
MRARIEKFALWYYTLFLLFFGVRVYNGLTLVQLQHPSIFIPRQDPLLWLWQFLEMPALMTGNLALGFDLLLLVLAFAAWFLAYKKKQNQVLTTLFLLVLWSYILSVFAYPSLSVRKYLGLSIIPVLFLLKPSRQHFFWELLRYYVLFIFSSSALWKLGRGSVLHSGQMQAIIEGQVAANMVHFPNAWYTKVGVWLLSNPSLLDPLFIGATIMQLTFLIGFLTKRYDRTLAILLVVFIICDYWIMRIEYWEFLIFLPLLWWKPVKEDNLSY